mgnify:CR=1 FL=1
MDKIVKEIEDKGTAIKDVVMYVKDTRGVHYTYAGVWEVLRRRSGLRIRSYLADLHFKRLRQLGYGCQQI